MAIGSVALINLLIILAIGIILGLAMNRYGRNWSSRFRGSSHSDLTSALVGIAGAFVGFHLSVIAGLLPSPLMHYVIAAVFAAIVLWLWRGR